LKKNKKPIKKIAKPKRNYVRSIEQYEVEGLFMAMTVPNAASNECRERAALLGPDRLCEFEGEGTIDFKSWCRKILEILRDENKRRRNTHGNDEQNSASDVRPHAVLRDFREKNLPLPCILGGVYQYVWYDMLIDASLEEVRTFNAKRARSLNRLLTIRAKSKDFQNACASETSGLTDLIEFGNMHEIKLALESVAEMAQDTLIKIYEYENDQLSVARLKREYLTVQRVHFAHLLPPSLYLAGERWWNELAALMSVGKMAFLSTGSVQGQSHTYTGEAVRSFVEDLSKENIIFVRKRWGVRDDEDILETLKTTPVAEWVKNIKLQQRFSPGDPFQLMIDLALAVRDKRISSRPLNSPPSPDETPRGR
jgi:hypothetical protein